MKITGRVISGEQKGAERGGKGMGNKKHKWRAQNKQGEVKNSMGNVEAKELICTTHGHELRWGNDGGRRDKVEGNNGGEEWDNYNSIIN